MVYRKHEYKINRFINNLNNFRKSREIIKNLNQVNYIIYHLFL